jgi:hypothetical protein
VTSVAETEAGLASGLNNASLQIGGAVGVAILSTVAVSGADGAASLAALTNGDQSTFAMAIAVHSHHDFGGAPRAPSSTDGGRPSGTIIDSPVGRLATNPNPPGGNRTSRSNFG